MLTVIYLEKNKTNFLNDLSLINWSPLYSFENANDAYNHYIALITNAFEKHFRLTKLSRKKTKDECWMTKGLKKSSK